MDLTASIGPRHALPIVGFRWLRVPFESWQIGGYEYPDSCRWGLCPCNVVCDIVQFSFWMSFILCTNITQPDDKLHTNSWINTYIMMTPSISKDCTQDAYLIDHTVGIHWTLGGYTYALMPEHAQKIEKFQHVECAMPKDWRGQHCARAKAVYHKFSIPKWWWKIGEGRRKIKIELLFSLLIPIKENTASIMWVGFA